MHACRERNSVADILSATKSKRYTHSRLMRMLMCAILGITETMLLERVPYVRVLSLSPRGGKLLRQIRSEAQIPLLTMGEQVEHSWYCDLERRAEALYGLFAEGETEPPVQPSHTRYCGECD